MSSSEKTRQKRVSVVVPNWNGLEWLETCLSSLDQQVLEGVEIILVDNGSVDGSVDFVKARFGQVRIIELGENTGFAKAVNVGIEHASANLVALLNNDTQVSPDWLEVLVTTLKNSGPEVAGVASRMLQMDDQSLIDDAGDRLSWYGDATKIGHGKKADGYDQARGVFSPCAGAALYRKSFLKEMGGFDERFFAYLEDVDLGLRGRLAGYRFVYEPRATVLHKGHGSSIRQGMYVRLMTCNRLLMFFGCLPWRLLLGNLPCILYGQIYFLVAYRKPIASLQGYLRFLGMLGHVSVKRKACRAQRKLSFRQIERLLHSDKPEPAFLAMITRGISKRLRGK